jgi:hypothetical protein
MKNILFNLKYKLLFLFSRGTTNYALNNMLFTVLFGVLISYTIKDIFIMNLFIILLLFLLWKIIR